MNPQQELERGRLAREVLENEIFVEAFATIDAEVIAQWKTATKADDREWLHQLSQAMRKLQSTLRVVMETGKLREEDIRRKQSLADRIKAPFRRQE